MTTMVSLKKCRWSPAPSRAESELNCSPPIATGPAAALDGGGDRIAYPHPDHPPRSGVETMNGARDMSIDVAREIERVGTLSLRRRRAECHAARRGWPATPRKNCIGRGSASRRSDTSRRSAPSVRRAPTPPRRSPDLIGLGSLDQGLHNRADVADQRCGDRLVAVQLGWLDVTWMNLASGFHCGASPWPSGQFSRAPTSITTSASRSASERAAAPD